MKDIFVSFFRIYHRTTLHDPAHSAAGELSGRMFSRQHNIDQDTKRINICASVRLGETVLLRCCKTGGSKDLGVLLNGIFIDPGCIKVDQYRFFPSQDDIIRYHIVKDIGIIQSILPIKR